MPIRKFRTIEEMNAADAELWCAEPDAAYHQRLRKLWETSARLNPRTFPKGVFKFRNQEEAQAQRDQLLTDHIRQVCAAAGDKIVQSGRRSQDMDVASSDIPSEPPRSVR